MSDAQMAELKKAIGDIAFQDEFFQKTLVTLQRKKESKTFERLSKFWLESKAALEAFARSADMNGIKEVIRERQAFIDQVIVGKIKLFRDEIQ